MNKICLVFFLVVPFSLMANCSALEEKYSAPKAEKRTIAQLKRWVGRKVDDNNDAEALLQCLIARAADNPNKRQVAGGSF
ncbi:hypothetical protein CCZ01_06900 [Helicobacter monodelphidis]|uniref:hypothetical protein n=1 Tax=Helicobacter sp. 15-1451 TaxID=2004995 RepID=UPI000DCE4414|nr:hypothetical protein [Helicobacter sp. 15-1451]RAX57186.1 hypothetical protein CCZ01_06900 [Helicobacter sp. 15-1451]